MFFYSGACPWHLPQCPRAAPPRGVGPGGCWPGRRTRQVLPKTKAGEHGTWGTFCVAFMLRKTFTVGGRVKDKALLLVPEN